jgi:hypothetical protein
MSCRLAPFQIAGGIAGTFAAHLRLRSLVEAGLLTRSDDPNHKQKAIYSLTKKAIALVPVFVQISAWGPRWLPATEAPRGQFLEAGGPPLWERFMAELRQSTWAAAFRPARPCAPRWKQPIRGSLQKGKRLGGGGNLRPATP